MPLTLEKYASPNMVLSNDEHEDDDNTDDAIIAFRYIQTRGL